MFTRIVRRSETRPAQNRVQQPSRAAFRLNLDRSIPLRLQCKMISTTQGAVAASQGRGADDHGGEGIEFDLVLGEEELLQRQDDGKAEHEVEVA